MVSQRNKPHKNRFRSKGKIKDKSKGKKVKDNYASLKSTKVLNKTVRPISDGCDGEVGMQITSQAKSPRSRANKRSVSTQYIEGVVKATMPANMSAHHLTSPSDVFRSHKQPRSHRVAALIPLNRGSRGDLLVDDLRGSNGMTSTAPNDTPSMQTLVHGGCSLTFVDPFACQRLASDESNPSALLDADAVDFASVLDTLLVADMIVFVINVDYNEEKTGDTSTIRDSSSDANVWFDDLGIQVDALGRHMVSLVNAIGAPSVFVNFQQTSRTSPEKSHKDTQRFQSQMKLHKRYLCSVLPPKQLSLTTTYHTCSTKAGAVKLWRALNETKLTVVKWKAARPYMLVDWHVVVPREGEQSTENGTLMASGYLRGAPLSVNQLVTFTGADTESFTLRTIDALGKTPLERNEASAVAAPRASQSGLILQQRSMERGDTNTEAADSSEHEMEEDELADLDEAPETFNDEAVHALRHVKRKMELDETSLPASIAMSHQTDMSKILKPSYRLLKVPEGVSGYQAAWYDYDENLIETAEEIEPAGHIEKRAFALPGDSTLSTRNVSRLDEPDDFEADCLSEEESEADPDALSPVRQRFFKYRPLPSAMMPSAMNTSSALTSSALSGIYTNKFSTKAAGNYWDPYQNLPEAYSKLCSQPLPYFRQCCKEGMTGLLQPYTVDGKVDAERIATPGQRVTVYIENIPLHAQQRIAQSSPLILSGLLPHEDKLSVLHASLTGLQNTIYQGEENVEGAVQLESKNSMIFHVGFRRYHAKGMFYSDLPQGHAGVLRVPTMNEQLPSGGSGQKIMETIHQRRATYCKSYDPSAAAGTSYFVAHYGLITHMPVPIFVLQDRSVLSVASAAMGESQDVIVTTGRALPPDPHVLILKKRRLLGKIYKVHQRSAVVKKMFLDDQDVKYFDKVELRTLRGVKGSIVKSIGTHGTFKAKFSAVVQQHDKVYIDLYKRVFPPGYAAEA